MLENYCSHSLSAYCATYMLQVLPSLPLLKQMLARRNPLSVIFYAAKAVAACLLGGSVERSQVTPFHDIEGTP